MVDASTRALLLKALTAPPAEDEGHWREWRASIRIDELDGDALRMLPLLSERLPQWLADDPARGLILGICKRAWSRNQIQLSRLAAVIALLREARIDPVVITGSAAWSFRHQPAIRLVEALEILIRREQLRDAAETLARNGWAAAREIPAGDELDRIEGLWFRGGDDHLKLSWRLLPGSPEIAGDCERLPRLTASGIAGADLLPDEEMLLHALAGYRDEQEIDWRCDALLLIGPRKVDWRRMQRLLRDAPQAHVRLRELREQWGCAIPVIPQTPTRFEKLWDDYRWRAWERGRKRSTAGFVGYLCERWWNVFVRSR